MANTRDVMGEQACLDALIAGTLTEFEDDGVYELRQNAFPESSALTSVSLPNCIRVNKMALKARSIASVSLPMCEYVGDSAFNATQITSIELPRCETIRPSAFGSCTKLVTAVLPSCRTISYNAFDGCNALTSITLGYDGVVSLDGSLPSQFKAGGTGTVYVPASQLAAYQASSKWSGINLAAIEG